MALVLADRVRETTTVTGTGTATLLGAVSGYQSFAAVGNANTTYYVIANQSASEWEVGIGTYTASGTTLSRDTVLSSSNSGSLVNFSAGTKDVFVDYPAGRAVYENAAGNVDGYPITGGTIDNTVIGGTTPAAGTFTTLIGGGGSANYFQTQGSATTKAVEAKALGSDTNIAFVIDSKGTGAIDLAAGSSGVNISNGGTVTAITRTATGSAYTSFPSVAITAPTTAGGVQATATAQLVGNSATVAGGGTGYTVNDVLTVTTGGGSGPITLTVTAVSGGVITAVTSTSGALTSIPTNPVAVSGGTGTGATFNIVYVVAATFTITNAGSGYVEQPTVTFSGGGGSGAAAYATVGSSTTLKTLAFIQNFDTSGGTQFQIQTTSGNNAYPVVTGGVNGAALFVAGSATNAGLLLATKGTSAHDFYTNGFSQLQARIAHTASAVNYVQVTGGVTAGGIATSPTIGSQGSDANVSLNINGKGNGGVRIGAQRTNFVTVGGSGSGGGLASFTAEGGDTNIDLTLTPKGTGNVRFGTYTGTISAITGYIEIKDSGGTVRRLAVVA